MIICTYSARGLWKVMLFSCFTSCCTVFGSVSANLARDVVGQVTWQTHVARTVRTATAYTVLRNENGCGQFYCHVCTSLNFSCLLQLWLRELRRRRNWTFQIIQANRGITTTPKGCPGNPSWFTSLFRVTGSANGNGCTTMQPRTRPTVPPV